MKMMYQIGLAISTFLLVASSSGRSSQQVLHDLNAAVVSADGQAVIRLTEELKALVPVVPAPAKQPVAASRKTILSHAVPKLQVAEQNNSTAGFVSTRGSVVVANAPEATNSIFDDLMFALTPEAKQELRAQLSAPQATEARNWIQTGGWYHCSYEGQPCNKCVGQVRYGAPHTQQWSAPKEITGGSIHCSAAIFGDPAPGTSKQCICHRSAFHMTKNENSGSYFQESWIFMLRFLARMQWLPFTGDRRNHGIELWSARHGGHTGGTLERYWIEKYVVEMYQNIPGGNCLEWGIYYVGWLSQCTNNFENKYEAVLYGQKQPSVEGNIVYGSIYDFPAVVSAAQPPLQFNFICATELFEHLEKPYEAAADLFHILAPGGAVLVTVPQQAQYHKVPQDFLRYTKEGMKHILEVAGFCVPNHLMAGSGDFIFDVGRNTGLQLQDFTIEELDEGYQRGYDNIADGAMTIHAMAYKPPHAHCPPAR